MDTPAWGVAREVFWLSVQAGCPHEHAEPSVSGRPSAADSTALAQ